MVNELTQEQIQKIRQVAAASAHTSMAIEGRHTTKLVTVTDAGVSRKKKVIVQGVKSRRASTTL